MWHAIGIFQPPGWGWFAIALGAGLVGAAGLLGACWRPPSRAKSS